MDDWYEILELTRYATRAEVVAAFRSLAQTCHPDRHPDDPGAAIRFKRIEAAFDTLSDAERRREYDREIGQYVKCRHCRKLCLKLSQRESSWRCQHCGKHVVDDAVGEEPADDGVPTFEPITPDADAAPIIKTGGWRQGKRPRRVTRRTVGGGFLTSVLIAAVVVRGCLQYSRENPNPTPEANGLAGHHGQWSDGGGSNRTSIDIRDICKVVVHPATQLPLHRPHDTAMAKIDRNPAWLAAPLTVVAQGVSVDGRRLRFVTTPYLDHCREVNEFYIWPPTLYPMVTEVYEPASVYSNEYVQFIEYEGRIYFARRILGSR